MNIGGRALQNGIMFQSRNYMVKARYDKDGQIIITEERTPYVLDNPVVNLLSSIPLLRGLITLFRLMWSVWRIILITMLIVVPLTMLLEKYKIINDTNIDTVNAGIQYVYVVVIFFIFWAINRRYGKFHGAEHKAINALEEYGKVDLEHAQKATRISPRCGTNFVFIIVMLKLIALLLHINSPVVNLSVFLVAYEIFELQETKLAFLSRPFIKTGEFIQKLLTTTEPTIYELRPAVEGINRLIQLERTNT